MTPNAIIFCYAAEKQEPLKLAVLSVHKIDA
jgi:hypothetical protein